MYYHYERQLSLYSFFLLSYVVASYKSERGRTASNQLPTVDLPNPGQDCSSGLC